MENEIRRKPRILCLHSFRTSGRIFQMMISRWPENVTGELDLVFADAPFPAEGKSDVEGIYDPPYFEWFKSDKEFKEFYDFEKCLNYLEDFMLTHGPFDGVLGFSQGATLAAALPGMQKEGVALSKVPTIKFLIIISGGKFGGAKFGLPKLAARAFSSPVNCPSLHIIGELDFLRDESKALMRSFVDPVVIKHAKGHCVPRLTGEDADKMLQFITKYHCMKSRI
ncbi:esterase AGAP003155 isoform X1 [Sesamum indicum]|uniref:Esterase AGAP003155 isoform X1 n=1 Tax=Sesamum indicum TaxID=4182 RepID=A0A6I9UHE5_SESIN|nr:esterase AGAP003155 isoform X1 [Sesamum indicum]